MKAGTLLVPKETPFGPPDARVAWAEALGNLLIVVEDAAGGVVSVNCPSDGRTYPRAVSDIAVEYEDPHDPDPFGRGWAATLERAAMEAARVIPARYGGAHAARYWQQVATVVRRVLEEEARPAPVR